jgi:hypothetical protein
MSNIIKYLIGILIYFVVLIGTSTVIIKVCEHIKAPMHSVLLIPCFVLSIGAYIVYLGVTNDN